MIEAKIEGKKVVETPAEHIAPVIDIMEALKKSLAEKRKPAQVATAEGAETVAEEAPKKHGHGTAGAPAVAPRILFRIRCRKRQNRQLRRFEIRHRNHFNSRNPSRLIPRSRRSLLKRGGPMSFPPWIGIVTPRPSGWIHRS